MIGDQHAVVTLFYQDTDIFFYTDLTVHRPFVSVAMHIQLHAHSLPVIQNLKLSFVQDQTDTKGFMITPLACFRITLFSFAYGITAARN